MIPGWFSFKQIYDMMLEQAEPGMVYVEIGAFLGKSTHYMIYQLPEGVEFHVIDLWIAHTENQRKIVGDADPYDLFRGNLSEYLNKMELHRMDSADAASLFDDNSVDFVLIDADHSYEAVKRDIKAWLPKVRGVMAGDDYNSPTWPGVRKAVDELLDAKQIGRNWIYDVRNSR